MKILFSLAALAVLAGAVWFYFIGDWVRDQEDMQLISVNGRVLKVKIADSNAERRKGLQHLVQLEGYDGMLFVFDAQDKVAFWNKNTLLDLDLIWIEGGRVLGMDFLPKELSQGLITITSPEMVDMALELPAGRAGEFGIAGGTLVSLPARLQ